MNKKIFIIVFLVLTSGKLITAQDKGFGLGIILGEPTGISAKYWTTSNTAFDFALGYSFTPKSSRLHFHMDYLFHSAVFTPAQKILIYYGPGFRIKAREEENSRFGIRGVLGAAWIPSGTPIDLFIEIVPILNLLPATTVNLNAGLGARFYF